MTDPVVMQIELDLDGTTIESRWNLMAKEEAENWSDEALTIQWCWPHSIWREHKDWWDNLPVYDRRSLILDWKCEHAKLPRFRLTYRQRRDDMEIRCKAIEELAEVWARVIRAAAKRGEVVPIEPNRQDPVAVCTFDRACDLAGVLVLPSSEGAP